MAFSRTQPTESNPAYVYAIELDNPLPQELQLIDPVREVILVAASPEDDEKLEEAAQNALPRIVEVGGDALYPRQAPPQPVTYFSRLSEPV